MNPGHITLDHGSGGKISHDLITGLLLPCFDNPILAGLDDGALLEIGGHRLAFATDSFVVDPIFFPGGDIGELAVNGTVNDLAMCGARPLYLSAGLILEEGLPMADLERITGSMQRAARAAGVQIVTGDTKVVPKGAADKIFINTSGIGLIPAGVSISGQHARPGDRIILSGTIADHGVTIVTQQRELRFSGDIQSDTAPLNHLTEAMLAAGAIHVLRDPTRGGVATTLCEIAQSARVGIRLAEAQIPLKPEVASLCELLGFDPLYLANEGKLIAIVPPEAAAAVLAAARAHPLGAQAAMVGEVTAGHAGQVVLETRIGGTRLVDMLAGEQLPRIC